MHWYALYITGFTTVLLFIILVALGTLLRAMELLDEKDRRGEHMWAKISEDEGETIEAIVGYR